MTGTLRSRYSDNALMGLGGGIMYKKLELGIGYYAGFPRNRRDIPYSTGIFSKGNEMRMSLAELFLSYAVLENYRFKASPCIGIGFMEISATDEDVKLSPALKELDKSLNPSCMVGFYFDIKLGGKNPNYMPKTNYCFLRIRYSYTYAGSEKSDKLMSGGMHYITLGVGLNCRDVRRDY